MRRGAATLGWRSNAGGLVYDGQASLAAMGPSKICGPEIEDVFCEGAPK